MPNEWLTGLSGLAAWPAAQTFLLVATRIGGAIAFIPIPGLRTAPVLARVILTVSLSLLWRPPGSLVQVRRSIWLRPTSLLFVL